MKNRLTTPTKSTTGPTGSVSTKDAEVLKEEKKESKDDAARRKENEEEEAQR